MSNVYAEGKGSIDDNQFYTHASLPEPFKRLMREKGYFVDAKELRSDDSIEVKLPEMGQVGVVGMAGPLEVLEKIYDSTDEHLRGRIGVEVSWQDHPMDDARSKVYTLDELAVERPGEKPWALRTLLSGKSIRTGLEYAFLESVLRIPTIDIRPGGHNFTDVPNGYMAAASFDGQAAETAYQNLRMNFARPDFTVKKLL